MESLKQITQTSCVKYLREDLITEILSRVPVKDLMRFTCVSKSWCSLIYTDSYLHRLHFQRTASLYRPLLFITTINESSEYCNYFVDLDSIDDHNINVGEFHNPFINNNESPRRDFRVIGSCHGMFVLQQQNSIRLALSNPTTKKHHMVPPNPAGDDNVHFLGLGYDNVHGRYKLVTRIKPNGHVVDLIIYDVQDGTWRKSQINYLGDHADYFYYMDGYEPRYANGAMYYYVDLGSRSTDAMKIICFDLAEEEFQVLERPEFDVVLYNPLMTVFDGRLCLSSSTSYGHDSTNNRTEFWMMECDSSSRCRRWTRFLSVLDVDFNALIHEYHATLVPVCFSACGSRILIVMSGWVLFWYDIEKKEFIELDNLNSSIIGRYHSTMGCCVRSFLLA